MENLEEFRIKPIKTRDDYDAALVRLEELMAARPEQQTDERKQLEILVELIEQYEEQNVPRLDFDAVDAIEFRLEQLGLNDSDLIPYLGSASRVSEILNRKRQLTVDMIRDLSNGLGIPEKQLLQQKQEDYKIPTPVFKQMLRRGYFKDGEGEKSSVLERFFSGVNLTPLTLFRKSKFRVSSKDDRYIAIAWSTKIIQEASKSVLRNNYTKCIDLEYMRSLVKYSKDEKNGPKKAIEKLKDDGIIVVIEPALTGAKIDGICILENKANPIIGLSLRYDRLDYFWFTLMHEIAHISLHIDTDITHIYDNMDERSNDYEIEREADKLASEALVDSAKWVTSVARIMPSPLAASALAEELGVHVAIVAGKYRYESGDWKHLAKFARQYTIRDKFKGIDWR